MYDHVYKCLYLTEESTILILFFQYRSNMFDAGLLALVFFLFRRDNIFVREKEAISISGSYLGIFFNNMGPCLYNLLGKGATKQFNISYYLYPFTF